jgi:15-cis-phytoene synthase
MIDPAHLHQDLALCLVFVPDAQKRQDISTLFAFLETLREVPRRVSEPLLGDIRFAWWQEALDEIIAAKPVRYQPLTEALKDVVTRTGLDLSPLKAVVAAQGQLLDTHRSLSQALTLVEASEPIVANLAARILGFTASDSLDAPMRLYGLSQLVRQNYIVREGLAKAQIQPLIDAARLEFKRLPDALLPLALPAKLGLSRLQGKGEGPLANRFKVLKAFLTRRL